MHQGSSETLTERQKSIPSLPSQNYREDKYANKVFLVKGIYTKVYKAMNTDLSKPVVIKELLYEHKQIREKFKKSIQDAFDISHLSNFITIYDFSYLDHPSKSRPYYIMQFIEGRTLKQDIKNRQKISYEIGIKIILNIGNAIIQARKTLKDNYYYLNIKPSNIMLDGENEPFISAFNLCVNFDKRETEKELERLLKSLKRKKGVEKEEFQEKFQEELAYLLPEKFNNQSQHGMGQQSDQYMLGLLAYEVFTGKIPPSIDNINNIDNIDNFESLKEGKAFRKIAFPDMDKENSKYEYKIKKIKEVILKMTELNPSERYNNLEEALEIIQIYNLFEDTITNINLVKKSFVRCIINKNFSNFFTNFYEKFKCMPGVREKFSKFEQDKRFWEKHHKLVEKAILLFFWYYEEETIFRSIKTPTTDEKFNFLDSIVGSHTNLDISEKLFDYFQMTLIESVIEYDEECNEETHKDLIKSAWEEVLKPGFDYIKSKLIEKSP